MHRNYRLAGGVMSLVLLLGVGLSWGGPPNNDVSDAMGNTAGDTGVGTHSWWIRPFNFPILPVREVHVVDEDVRFALPQELEQIARAVRRCRPGRRCGRASNIPTLTPVGAAGGTRLEGERR